jgi:hypothetical protein
MKNITIAKRTLLAATSIIFLVLLPACQDLLEENPKEVVEENFYNTPSEFESAVNAVYIPFRGGTFIGSYAVILDTHTDWGYGRGSRAVLNSFQGFNSNWTNGVGGMWNLFYQGIRNANIVIRNAPADNTNIEITQSVAEARFLRAFYYFHLVRNWSDVPLRTVENMEVRDLARTPVNEVYDLIVADLLVAEADLPEVPKHLGRPTTYAAKTMLSDVYLTLGMYTEARNKSVEVIDADVYSLVPVSTPDEIANKIFGPDVLTTTEEILSIKYSRMEGQGCYMPWVINHPSSGLFSFGGAYAHYSKASDPFYKNWDNNDLRKGMWDMINFGVGDSTLVSRKFPDPDAPFNLGAGNDFPLYRYPEVLLMYAEADARVSGGPTTAGMEALNQVHRRAYGEDPESPSPFDLDAADYDLDSFIDLVIQERGHEFIFEAKRWFTLKRTNKAQEIIMQNRGIQIADRVYKWPLPNSELNFNDLINGEDQNPGY